MLTDEHESLLRVFIDRFNESGVDRFHISHSPFNQFGRHLSIAQNGALLEQLIAEGYLEPEGFRMGNSYQYLNLSSTGKNYFEQKKLIVRVETKRKRSEVRWRLVPIFISILALVISALALLVSISANLEQIERFLQRLGWLKR